MRWLLLPVALCALAASVPATAAEGIDCALERLTPEQREKIGAAAARNDDADAQSRNALFAAISSCADTHGWSPEAIEDVSFYSIVSAMEPALLARSPFTAPQMDRLRRAIESVDQAALARVVGPMVQAGIDGRPQPELTAEGQRLFAQIALRAGVPMDESSGEFFGEYLGLRYLLASRAASFANR